MREIEIECVEGTEKNINNYLLPPHHHKELIPEVIHLNGKELRYFTNRVTENFKIYTQDNESRLEIDSCPHYYKSVAKNDPKIKYKIYIEEVYQTYSSGKIIQSLSQDPFIIVLGNELDSLKAYIFKGTERIYIPTKMYHTPPILYYTGLSYLQKDVISPELSVVHKFCENDTILSFNFA